MCNTKGPPIELVPRHGVAEPAGGPSCKLICVHTPADPQGARAIPLLRAGPFLHSPFRTTSYIYLRISLFYERPRGIVRLIKLPEACAAGYHARRIALLRVVRCRLDAIDVCCLLTVSSAKRQARRNPLADRPLLNDLFDVT